MTVIKVKVTDDLKIAKVYLSFLENKKPVQEVLEIIKLKYNIIRRQLSLKLTLKYTPKLIFYQDNSLEYAQHIDDLIKKIHIDD